MITREVTDGGQVVLEVIEAGVLLLTVTVHQSVAEDGLHRHLFQWLHDRQRDRAVLQESRPSHVLRLVEPRG